MTIIETQTMNAVQAMNRKMRDQNSIDWEQRRYEIAKKVLPQCIVTTNEVLLKGGSLQKPTLAEQCANMAVSYADALIKELKTK